MCVRQAPPYTGADARFFKGDLHAKGGGQLWVKGPPPTLNPLLIYVSMKSPRKPWTFPSYASPTHLINTGQFERVDDGQEQPDGY